MKILAIETSCDETAIAIIDANEKLKMESGQEKTYHPPLMGTHFEILSNRVFSQIKIHRPFGGVVPNLAKREHIKNLPVVLKMALKDAGIKGKKFGSNIDVIAVTYGPGLEPALWTGINFAEDLAKKWNIPLIGVNHLEGHIYSSMMSNSKFEIRNSKQIFPLLTLIVSGGHTELVLTKKHAEHKILGETLDDAVGEAFDKVARMLKLSYPGGPEISKLAKKGNSNAVIFPRPMIHSRDLNFSFSGLKTAVLYKLREITASENSLIPLRGDIAASFEQAAVDILVSKTLKAAEQYNPKTIALGGGVAANDRLRNELSKKLSGILLPSKIFTGDNAAMIAVAAYFRTLKNKSVKIKNLEAMGNLKL